MYIRCIVYYKSYTGVYGSMSQKLVLSIRS
jgi:hypothetical protein